MTNNQPECNNKSQHATFYSTLMAFYLHQDHLMWSRVHFLIGIHAAVFVGIFIQRGNWIGPAIAFFAALMTLLIMIIMLVDQWVRDQNVPLIKAVEAELLSQKIKEEFPEGIQLSVPLPSWATRIIVGGTLIMFLAIDFVVGCLLVWRPDLFPFPAP